MDEPLTEFKDGNIFAYLKVHDEMKNIAIWVRREGSWTCPGRERRVSDKDVLEATDAAGIEELLRDGSQKVTYYTRTASDLCRWTLVTDMGTIEGTNTGQPRFSFPYIP